MSNHQSIYVTEPFLPPLEEFIPYLRTIWESRRLTNRGPFHQEFEEALAEYLGVPHLALFTNGTIALVTALQTLRITGEVITTPYSFVATSHSLFWNNIKPVFVDIDPDTYNLDPAKIEPAITPQTTAILPVHCYGNPCDVSQIQQIADTYGLKVIYDAAHGFGVKYRGESLLECGDLSVLSFHATKVFTTFEGGAIVCQDDKTKQRIDYLKNFGFADEVTVMAPGINGKMSEFQAALGLLQLKYVGRAIERRKQIDARYRRCLEELPGIKCMAEPKETLRNYAYFPIRIGNEYCLSRDELYARLRANNIFARRYFYPLISAFPMYRGLYSSAPENLPVANRVTKEILCLPIYPQLADSEVDRIAKIIRSR
jgi:dTDP-4-amino-4,6-dideoxygalactose transaminase